MAEAKLQLLMDHWHLLFSLSAVNPISDMGVDEEDNP